MKQNLPLARLASRYKIAIVTVAAILCFGCATIPRDRTLTTLQNDATSKALRRLNINNATALDLETLPGVGKVIAERIVDHRTRYGSFRRVDHLMMVRGISEKKFVELRPLIMVE